MLLSPSSSTPGNSEGGRTGGYLPLSTTPSATTDPASQYMPPQLSTQHSLQAELSVTSIHSPGQQQQQQQAVLQKPLPSATANDLHFNPLYVPHGQEITAGQEGPASLSSSGPGSSSSSHEVEMSNPAHWVANLAPIATAKKPAQEKQHQGDPKAEVLLVMSSDKESERGAEEEDEEDGEEAAERKKLIPEDGPKEGPIRHKWNLGPLVLLMWFLGAAAYYFFIRITQLNGLYGLIILCLEAVGLTSFLPYAILLTRGLYPTGSMGLPPGPPPASAASTPSMKTPRMGIATADPSKPSFSSSTSRAAPVSISPFSTPPRPMGALPFGAPPTVPEHAMQLSFTAHTKHPSSVSSSGEGSSSMDEISAASPVSMSQKAKGHSFVGLRNDQPATYDGCRFHVRVLVPCYKEPLKVVAATVEAALEAQLPANVRRTIYLCDDGKDPEKKALVETMGPDVVYVTGRKRKPNEINGKSGNLNNCLKNVIYASWPRNAKGEVDWTEISTKEVVTVFDADMCAKPEFFLRLLEVLVDDEYALVLSPQSFHNISPDADLFNNINRQFWECWLPGAFAWGYIACTGTNFCIRARALAHCGWFPDYTITEDYALGMLLKARGYRATYLMLYLAVGEAPDEIRNVFRQRSRWTKGHFQVFFKWDTCPLWIPGLPFFQRLWYSYASWAPICTVITIPTFMLVPFMSIFFGFNPVTITFEFVLSSTIYYVALMLIQAHSHSRGDHKLMWFAHGSSTVLWFTYFKAFVNSILAKLGMKTVAFKVTEKVKPQTEATALAALQLQQPGMLHRMGLARSLAPQDQPLLPNGGSSSVSTFCGTPSGMLCGTPSGTPGGMLYGTPSSTPGGLPKPASSACLSDHMGRMNSTSPLKPAETADTQLLGSMATPSCVLAPPTPSTTSVPISSVQYSVRSGAGASPSGENQAKAGWERFKAVLGSFKPAHIKDFDEMFDPLVLLLFFLFSAATFAVGMWQSVNSITARAPASFALDSPMKGSPYLIISTAWAFVNLIFPYLFLHYCVSAGRTFKVAAKVLMIINHIVLIGAIVLIWFLIPMEFNLADPLRLQVSQYIPSQVLASDTSANITFVQGLDATPVSLSLDQNYISYVNSQLSTARAQERRRTLLAQPDEEFDPAALTDEELHAGGPLAAWQRSLLQSSLTASTAAASLPPNLDLSGGLLVKDNVKYGQPMGYAITQLAWSLLQFPQGFTARQQDTLRQVIRSGAEYLIRCLLRTTDGRPVFVAQLGDARDYVAVQDMVQDPGAAGKVWTSPQQDPYLNGARPRKAWLLDENHVGADLLANVAAGLAAASQVLRPTAPEFSSLALDTAKTVYALASVGQPFVRPHSYCEFVPCQMNVTTRKDTLMVPIQKVPPRPQRSDPECYFIDWPSATCQMLWTVADCNAMAGKQAEVYLTKSACCNTLSNTGVWLGLVTKAQGICAVPDKQWQCYIPDSSQRTCYEEQINNVTGWGCNGKGLEIYATPLACCNYLVQKKYISADDGKPGAGLCARASIDPSFRTCYVPSYANATCNQKFGIECDSYGARTSFSEPTACCNDLIPELLKMGVNPQGVCEFPKNASNLFRPSPVQSPTQQVVIVAPAPAAAPAPAPVAADTPAPAPAPAPVPAPAEPAPAPAPAPVTAPTATAGPVVVGHAAPIHPRASGQVHTRTQHSGGNRRGMAEEAAGSKSTRRALLQDASPVPPPPPTPLPAAVDPSAIWKPPSVLPPEDDAVTLCTGNNDCAPRPVLQNTTVTFYNSTSTLDDMAWGGVWLYKATQDQRYLGGAQHYLDRHYQEDVSVKTLTSDRTYYAPDWNNLAWASNLLMLQLTGNLKYDAQMRTLLNAWVFGSSVKPQVGVAAPRASSSVNVTAVNTPQNYTSPTDGQAYVIVPTCIATSSYEVDCFDGIDNDCDGTVDREDIDCGLFPVVYTPKEMAYSQAPSLPHAAAASWLGMVYAETQGMVNARKLRCWALDQVAYMMGVTPDTRSYIVGYRDAPGVVRHMASSCPAPSDDGSVPVCNWDNAFWPTVKNPQMDLLRGALVAGPDINDTFTELRINPQTQVTLDGTLPLTGVLAGLLQTGTGLRSCELMHGLYQRLVGQQEL